MKTNLFVGNLSWKMSDQDLSDVFAAIGEVVSAKIITDRATGRSKGFGFVEMATEDDAAKAVEQLEGHEVAGREIHVNFARDKE